jgi:hypothetical protein
MGWVANRHGQDAPLTIHSGLLYQHHTMPTVLKKDGFRVVIYFDDHSPSHVHIISADSEVKINLGDETVQPEIIEYRGKQGIAVKALKLVIFISTRITGSMERDSWRSLN